MKPADTFMNAVLDLDAPESAQDTVWHAQMPTECREDGGDVLVTVPFRAWRFEKAGARAHIFGKLYCPLGSRDGCRMNVYSTPSDPEEHAQRIIRRVQGCPHS